MPGEVIDRPNPAPRPSHLPDLVDQLLVQSEKTNLDDDDSSALSKYRRAACYVAAGELCFDLG
jgi:xylulose-5-phosphate/fructose-6-phosphate phosphoketolase